MKAEFYKVRGTEMEEMMKRGNNNEISSMISKKQQALKFSSIEYPVTFKSLFDYGFGANHMWVSDKESGKRLILVEF